MLSERRGTGKRARSEARPGGGLPYSHGWTVLHRLVVLGSRRTQTVPVKARQHARFPVLQLSPDEVRKVAHLARLALEPERLTDHARELSAILTLVDALQQADTAAVEPMAHPLDLSARLRADAVTEADVRDACQAIAPAVEEGLYLVPRVIE